MTAYRPVLVILVYCLREYKLTFCYLTLLLVNVFNFVLVCCLLVIFVVRLLCRHNLGVVDRDR